MEVLASNARMLREPCVWLGTGGCRKPVGVSEIWPMMWLEVGLGAWEEGVWGRRLKRVMRVDKSGGTCSWEGFHAAL